MTDTGVMGTETTIGGYSQYDPNEDPEFFRVRKAMQYGNSLDEMAELMKKRNNGGYANSWFLADANTGKSCVSSFDAGKFLAEQIQWSHLEGYLKDRPTQQWTPFSAGETP